MVLHRIMGALKGVKKGNRKRVLLFGVDGSAPGLIFDKWRDELPNINSLMKKGCYAKLNSTIPPVTISAWNSMISGKDTSELGIFNYTYKDDDGKMRLTDSSRLKSDLMWDILSRHNRRSIGLYVPLSYPVKPINGVLVSGFLTPDIDSDCTYPPKIKEKIKALGDTDMFFDVAVGLGAHKALDTGDLVKNTYTMTKMQLALLKDLVVNEKWDFFMSVMIGSDRLQHMVWKHFDEKHRKFIKDSPYKDALKDYYIYLDKELGEIIDLAGEDTIIIFASDHGFTRQEGKININNWLMDKGYLHLKKEYLEEIKGKNVRLKQYGIDWDNTIAYAGGAYHARMYLNKEKLGDKYKETRERIISELMDIKDDKGHEIKTKIYKTDEIYADTSSPECPDIFIYFDELRWASNPDLGSEGLYSWKTAVGADSAGHDSQGCFIIAGKGIPAQGDIGEVEICQVAPTILSLLDVPIPDDIKAKKIDGVVENDTL